MCKLVAGAASGVTDQPCRSSAATVRQGFPVELAPGRRSSTSQGTFEIQRMIIDRAHTGLDVR
jgi:hypothetical protein